MLFNLTDMSKARFKKGDIVRVKAKYDTGCDMCSYPFHFTRSMLEDCGGQVFKIKDVVPHFYPHNDWLMFAHDGFEYRLEDDPTNSMWADSMFVLVTINEPTIF